MQVAPRLATCLLIVAATLAGCSSPAAHKADVAGPLKVTATIALGHTLGPIVVDPVTDRIFVSDGSDDKIWVIDGGTQQVLTTVSTAPNSPSDLAIDTTSNTLFAECNNGAPNYLCVIDGATNTMKVAAPLPIAALGLAVDPTRHQVYVGSDTEGAPDLDIFDESTYVLGYQLPVGGNVTGVLRDPSANVLYVATQGSTGAHVLVIDQVTDDTLATDPVGDQPLPMAVDTAAHIFYVVGGSGDATVDVIDGSTFKEGPPVSVAGAGGVAVDPSTGAVFVSDFTGNAVQSFARGASKVLNTVPVGKGPQTVAFNPVTHLLYVANTTDGTVSVVSGG